jgi:hypothetical protein
MQQLLRGNRGPFGQSRDELENLLSQGLHGSLYCQK